MISQNPLCLCDLPDARLIAYITQAFENAEAVFAPYSNEQISQTFWYLIGSGSDAALALLNDTIPWQDRERCIRSFYTLFEQLFAKRCLPLLGHLNEDSPLNRICYMWWDIFPLIGTSTAYTKITDLCFELMASILKLESDACRESALHGLGHFPHRASVQSVITRFLDETPNIRPELRDYALRAIHNAIL